MIDLRSDTTTRPSQAMREAMMHAEVGDDVYREDPTVTRLEKAAAQLTGKEAALFVSSGSMGNLLSLYINGGRGNEILTYRNSHIMLHEVASPTVIAGVLPIGLDAPRGILDPKTIEAHIHPSDYTVSSISLIEIENTMDGTCYPLSTLKEIRKLADAHDLKVHMDGARLFNAVTALQVKPEEICRYADTVTFCLSKGLGAPVGSMLCGTEEFIQKALKIRKMLGGGMRQVGILAAAGIYALEHNIERLEEDHTHAKLIAQALNESGWAVVDLDQIETNIIFFTTIGITAAEAVKRLSEHDILCFSTGSHEIRMVTHLDISDEDINQCIMMIKDLT